MRGSQVLLVALSAAVTCRAQSACDDFAAAEAHYAEGAFEEAAGLIQGCASGTPLAFDEAVPVYRLLAMAHLQAGDSTAAKQALLRLLVRDSGYEPDYVEDPPPYRALVDDVKRALDLPSAAEARCDPEVDEAAGAYRDGEHGRAVGLLRECLARPTLEPQAAVRAHRLLALVHLERGAFAEARAAVLGLLRTIPAYEPDPVRDPPAYVDLVGIVRRQVEEGS